MAHVPGSQESAHPDLTAMLDVVMQMLMYFIMCARFINEQTTADIHLPKSQAAKPMTRGEGDVLFLNVNAEGKVLTLGEPPMNLSQAKFWLEKQAAEFRDPKDNQVRAAVVVRADRDASYEHVYRVLQACKDKGFRKFKLRAEIVGG
jgi:biopolymer transport protein ExbD